VPRAVTQGSFAFGFVITFPLPVPPLPEPEPVPPPPPESPASIVGQDEVQDWYARGSVPPLFPSVQFVHWSILPALCAPEEQSTYIVSHTR
jgi:hypothetical protein